MKLERIRPLGRYKCIATGKTVNVKKGVHKARRNDVLFYLFRGTRIFISSNEFYDGGYERVFPNLAPNASAPNERLSTPH